MSVHEIVVISGKGGTGKTTLVASLTPFLDNNVIADCDVDAPDLDILLKPDVMREESFSGSRKAVIDSEKCIACGICAAKCRFSAISEIPAVISTKCEGCGVCVYVCSENAISIGPANTGSVFHSETGYGPMIHGKLVPGEETSGKLVAAVRERAVNKAKESGRRSVLIDGSPGIACNVISSISGADTVIVVTEPTQSGFHDMIRVLEVIDRFSGTPIIVINRFDISESISSDMEQFCREKNIEMGLKLPMDTAFVKAVTDREIPSLAASGLFEEAGFSGFLEKLKNRIGE